MPPQKNPVNKKIESKNKYQPEEWISRSKSYKECIGPV